MSFLGNHGSSGSNFYSKKKTAVYFIIKIANVPEALKFFANKNQVSLSNISRAVDDFIDFHSQSTKVKIGNNVLYDNQKLIEKVFAQNSKSAYINIPNGAAIMKLHYRIHKNTKATDLESIIQYGSLIKADLPGNTKLSVTGETTADYDKIKNSFANCVTTTLSNKV